jgi:uncharacterized membrane protein
VRTIGNRIAPPRFLMFLALLPLAFLALRAMFGGGELADMLAMAFDAAALVLLLSLLPVIRHADAPYMRAHAARNDANRLLVLVFTTLLTVAVMAAIAGEAQGARQGDLVAAAKLVVTLVLIWLFLHVP